MSEAQSPEAYLDEVIERALAPYVDKVPADVLEEMRLAMREELRAHPTTMGLAKRLRARAPQMRSDELAPSNAQTQAPTKTEKGRR